MAYHYAEPFNCSKNAQENIASIDKVMVLPTDVTKAVVYSKYKQACEANDWIAFGCSGFYELWQQLLPHISVSKPSTDLCFTCQQNNLSIQQSSCLTEEEKQRRLITAQDDLALARKEWECYNDQLVVAKNSRETRNQANNRTLLVRFCTTSTLPVQCTTNRACVL